MPRSIWNGTITFGLIAVPVKVSSAVQDRGVHFHQVHAPDGARITQRRVCSQDGKEVPYKRVAKGYEVSSGEYVLLSADEIAAAAGTGAHRIALEEFVAAGAIDPDYYARTYYLGAGDDGHAAYRLLHDALAAAGRAGIGRWVFHNREYLVAVRAREDLLTLHTMRFADELVAPSELDIDAPRRAPGQREAEMAAALVDSLRAPFDPEAFKDTHREQLLRLIARKAKGKEIALPKPTEPQASSDLMHALQDSLGASRAAPRRKRSEPAKSKATSKSKTAKKSKTSTTPKTSKTPKRSKTKAKG